MVTAIAAAAAAAAAAATPTIKISSSLPATNTTLLVTTNPLIIRSPQILIVRFVGGEFGM